MGTEYSFGALFMQAPEGPYQRVMDVGTFQDITQHQPIHEIRTDMDMTFTGTFTMSRQTRKRIINGWRAKGPVRERAIQRARTRLFKMTFLSL